MPENQSNAKVEAAFQEFVENYEQYDVGLDIFDEKLRKLEEDANDNGGSFSELIEPAIEQLDEEWLYHNEIARVTGRLYLVDDLPASLITETWGQPDIDEDGNYSFFVENVELQSLGIVDGPHGEVLEDDTPAAKIGYAFVLPASNAAYPQFILYPGEASRHEYPHPTPEAVDLRLHKRWPEQLAIIDTLIQIDSQEINKLPRRLVAVARKFDADFKNSVDFREWVTIYINERLKLDQVWPYALQVEHELFCYDGDGSDSMDEAAWLEVACDKPMVLHGRRPQVEFNF